MFAITRKARADKAADRAFRDRLNTGLGDGRQVARVADQTADVNQTTDDTLTEDEQARTVEGLNLIGNPYLNLHVDRRGTWATFLLGDVSWLCIDDDTAGAAMRSFGYRMSALVDHTIRFRVTSSPFDTYSWAKALDEDHPAPDEDAGPRQPGIDYTRLPDVEGGDSFADWTERMQRHMADQGYRNHTVAMGVRITTDRLKARDLVKIASPVPLGDKDGNLETIRIKLGTITQMLAGEGTRARPLDPDELSWLFHASIGMGAPVPPMLTRSNKDGYWRAQAAAYVAPVTAFVDPLGATTTVQTLRNGEVFENHVAVLYATDLENGGRDLDDRGLMPFLAWPQTLPFPVEVVAEFNIVSGSTKRQAAQRHRRIGQSIQKEHAKHDDEATASVQRGIDRARDMEDETTSKNPLKSTRAEGHVLFAVHDPDERQAGRWAADLIAAASEQQGMTLLQPKVDQYLSYRAFTPSEPIPAGRNQLDTEMNLEMLASSVPHATTSAGDAFGLPIGPISGGHSQFILDALGGAANDTSNLIAGVGEPGSGKSTFGGLILAEMARLGYRSVGNDPSGMWERLAQVPSLKNDARVLDLYECRPGTLMPSLLVPEPKQIHFDTIEEYEADVERAYRQRMTLTINALRNLVPYAMLDSAEGGQMIGAIREAVTTVGGEYGMNPWDVVQRLRHMGGVGPTVAAQIESATKLRGGGLIFPPLFGEVNDDYIGGLMEQATLTIVKMTGISITTEAGKDRREMDEEQQESRALLELAAYFSMRVIYSDKDPKVVANDELGLSGGEGGGAFKSLLTRLGVDSRKWNALVILLAQNPGMLYRLDPEIANLLGQVWLGRMKKDAARASLKLAGLPEGYRYEELINALGQGQFLVSDWQGRKPVVTVDLAAVDPAVREALDTTPAQSTRDRSRRRLGVPA